MTKEQYIKITKPLRENPERARQVNNLNHILTGCQHPGKLFRYRIRGKPGKSAGSRHIKIV